MSLERIFLIISGSLNVLLIILSVALWPDRLLPKVGLFYNMSKTVENKTVNLSNSNNFASANRSVFLGDNQLESFRPIRDWSQSLPEISAQAAGVYLLDSKKMLFSQNLDLVLPIASLTKVMTATIILEQLPKEQTITVDQSMLASVKQSKFIVGESMTVESLIYAMLITSNNDAANILAQTVDSQHTSGYFVALMNQKAQSLGLKKTIFVDASGLNPGNVATIRDLIGLTESTIKEQPVIWQIMGLPVADVWSADKKISYHLENTNQLLGALPQVVAGKTGYTEEAQGCLLTISQTSNKNFKMVNIVLASQDRFGTMRQLINNVEKAYLW